ncbi:MAG: hydrogenase [Sulfurospirillum sp.]|nr:hydrogenase [Sulfurospirillum sp.]
MLIAFFIWTLLAIGLSYFGKTNHQRAVILGITALLHVSMSFVVLLGQNSGMDALSVWILVTLSLLFGGIALHAIGYFSHCLKDNSNLVVIISLHLFLFFATGMMMAKDLISMWIFLESSSLSCAPLIYYTKNKGSIEATWKYLFLVSIGILLALIGILFLAYSSLIANIEHMDLDFFTLFARAEEFNTTWFLIAFVFIFIGFATKIGLFPLHLWKVDAYSEEPGLFGALMAGGMTTLSWLAMMRLMQIMHAAHQEACMRDALIVFGILSVLFGAFSMLKQNDTKRLMAYSSVEQMGLIAIGFGLGGAGIWAAMYHLFNNALLKGTVFIALGNVKRVFGTRDAKGISGAIRIMPYSAFALLIALFAIVGTPPFGSFVSIFHIIQGTFSYSILLFFALIFGLVIAFFGMSRTILGVVRGKPPTGMQRFHERSFMFVSPFLFLGIVAFIGLYMPSFVSQVLLEATQLLGGVYGGF